MGDGKSSSTELLFSPLQRKEKKTKKIYELQEEERERKRLSFGTEFFFSR
jgi:hypothetical protein